MDRRKERGSLMLFKQYNTRFPVSWTDEREKDKRSKLRQSNYRSLIADNNSHLYDRLDGNAREIASRFVRAIAEAASAIIHFERP